MTDADPPASVVVTATVLWEVDELELVFEDSELDEELEDDWELSEDREEPPAEDSEAEDEELESLADAESLTLKTV